MYEELTDHMGSLGEGPACRRSIFFAVRNGEFKVGCMDYKRVIRGRGARDHSRRAPALQRRPALRVEGRARGPH